MARFSQNGREAGYMTSSGWWTVSVVPASNTQSDVEAAIIAEFILPLSNRSL